MGERVDQHRQIGAVRAWAKRPGELGGAALRPVDDDDLARAFVAQPPRRDGGHLAGTDDHHRLAGQVAEMLLRGVDRCGGNRGRVAGDCGAAAGFFAGIDRLTEERVQRLAQGPRTLRLHVGVLDLAQNLGFADQHRVETGAHPQEVFDGLCPEQRVHVRLHVAHVTVPEVIEECFELRDPGLVVFQFGVDLEPAAGLQHQRLAHRFVIAQRDQRFSHRRR